MTVIRVETADLS